MTLTPQQTIGLTSNVAPTKRIFLADSSPLLCELAKYHLENEGYAVETTVDLDTLYDTYLGCYQAVIVDYDMPGLDAYDFVENIKLNGDTCNVTVLVVCKKTSENRAYETLDAGADAVLRKPFSMRELSARLKAILRRVQPAAAYQPAIRYVSHEGLTVDLESNEVTLLDENIFMPHYMAETLGFLMSHANHFFTAAELGEALWPDKPERHSDAFLSLTVNQIKQLIGRYALYLQPGPRFAYCNVD